MKFQPFSTFLALSLSLLSAPIVFAQPPARPRAETAPKTPPKTPARPPLKTSAKAERDLLKELNKLSALYEAASSGAPDDHWQKIMDQNMALADRLQELTEKIPTTLTYPFSSLITAGMHIATSKDGLFRIYSWDALEGGTAHTYNKVYQYKIGDSVYSKLVVGDGNDGSRFSTIYTLDANQKRYYLGVGHLITTSLKGYASIQAFTLENGRLNDTTPIIKTRSGLTSTLGFDYFMDAKAGDGDLFRYNDSTKTIRFPVVLEGGQVTKRTIAYQFKGDYFEKVD